MELFTREQLKEAYKIGVGKGFANITIDDLKPIVLPSDEEIEKNVYTKHTLSDLEFIKGAKWMKKQILNQNK